MNQFLENIFKSKEFKNSKGEIVKIHSETSKGQCEYIQNIIVQNHLSKSIEIGFAYGVSTLAIIEEIAKNEGSHVVIDKFQSSSWGGNGLNLIECAGYSSKLEFHEEYCYKVLPKFLEQNRTFDFAYIDSTKQFDWILVDFFYLDKILDVNGIIVFDDVAFPGIRKVLRYISQFPNYQVHSQFPNNYPLSNIGKLKSKLKHLPLANRILKDEIIVSDFDLKINSSCVALKKVGEDKRKWNWHTNF